MIIKKSIILILRWWVTVLLLGLRSHLLLIVVWARFGFASNWTYGGLHPLLVWIHIIFRSMNFLVSNLRYLLTRCFAQWPSTLLIVTVLKTANSYTQDGLLDVIIFSFIDVLIRAFTPRILLCSLRLALSICISVILIFTPLTSITIFERRFSFILVSLSKPIWRFIRLGIISQNPLTIFLIVATI